MIDGASPTTGMTMSDQLGRWARRTPDAPALWFDGTSRTYAELDDRVGRLAAGLTSHGVGEGDRLAVLSPNSMEVWESFVAGTRIGVVVVPLNFRLVGAEIAFILADSGATAVVVDASLARVAAEALAALDHAPTTVVVGGPVLELPDAVAYDDLLAAPSPPREAGTIDESAPAFIMYTSGTTGRPKGAVLTHRNLLMHVFSQLGTLGGHEGRRVDAPGTPLFHIAGVAGGLPPLLHGGTHVILRSGGFDPSEVLDIVERLRITTIGLVPSMWAQVVAVPDLAERDLSCLRVAYWGAAPASRRLVQTMIDRFPQGTGRHLLRPDRVLPGHLHTQRQDAVEKVGSIGRPMLNVEARVVDTAMSDVQPGEVGEIVYRSPMIMRGYWNAPEATAEAFAGGWFHSGDLVRADDDGFLYVVDRLKDMIISGGENIYCAEVEGVLGDHPGVAEVALIGVHHEQWGETPVAILHPADAGNPVTAEELAAWCEGRLARYKRPTRYVMTSDPLPPQRQRQGRTRSSCPAATIKGERRTSNQAATRNVSGP